MATIDAEAYFTNGLCVPSGGLDGVSYFTLGLIVDGTAPPAIVPRGGMDEYPAIGRTARQKAIREAQEEADVLLAIILAIDIIEDDLDG